MNVLIDVGLASLALGALSGWVVVLTVEAPHRLKALGFKHPARFRQAHLDWIMMGLILIAVGVVLPGLPTWVVALVLAGTIVNPLLFLPLAVDPAWQRNAGYRVASTLSFACVSAGLTATFVIGLGR